MTHQKEPFSTFFKKCKDHEEYKNCHSLMEKIDNIGTNYKKIENVYITEFIPNENEDFKIRHHNAAKTYEFEPKPGLCEIQKKTFAELYKKYENYEQEELKKRKGIKDNKVKYGLKARRKKYGELKDIKEINEVCKMTLLKLINGIGKDYNIEKKEGGEIIYNANNITLTDKKGMWTFDYEKEAFDECRDITINEEDCENEDCEVGQNAGTRKTRRRKNSKYKKSRNNRRKSKRRYRH